MKVREQEREMKSEVGGKVSTGVRHKTRNVKTEDARNIQSGWGWCCLAESKSSKVIENRVFAGCSWLCLRVSLCLNIIVYVCLCVCVCRDSREGACNGGVVQFRVGITLDFRGDVATSLCYIHRPTLTLSHPMLSIWMLPVSCVFPLLPATIYT